VGGGRLVRCIAHAVDETPSPELTTQAARDRSHRPSAIGQPLPTLSPGVRPRTVRFVFGQQHLGVRALITEAGPAMRINVVGKQMDVTEAIKTYSEGKCAKLTKHFDRVQQITVRIEQQPHNKGFAAEVLCDVEKHDDFVAKADHADLYTAIDEAVGKVDRQIVAFKEKLKQGKHHA